MRPHYSQSSRENATPSSGTSSLTSYQTQYRNTNDPIPQTLTPPSLSHGTPKIWHACLSMFGPATLIFCGVQMKLCWAWVYTNWGIPGPSEKVVLYPFLVVPCPMFLLSLKMSLCFYLICKCFYHLSWKAVFNIEQNAVSYDSSTVVNVVTNQTRWWRHLWSYTKGPVSEHHVRRISCVVGENPASRYHLEKKQQLSKNEVKTGKK